MLEFRDCTFRQGTFDLSVDWSLANGAHLAVIGPSGAGKSTLLAGIAGFADRSAGRLLWDGADLPVRPDQRPVAMLFQDHNLFPHLSIAQNVGLGLRPSLRLTRAEADQIQAALRDVGLPGLEDRRPADVSGGQQSRAALARVLVMGRPIILMDEPFAALGPALRREMLQVVKDVAHRLGATLLMVTHDPGEARALGGLVSFVEAGVAQAPVAAHTFFTNPPAGMQAYAGLMPRD